MKTLNKHITLGVFALMMISTTAFGQRKLSDKQIWSKDTSVKTDQKNRTLDYKNTNKNPGEKVDHSRISERLGNKRTGATTGRNTGQKRTYTGTKRDLPKGDFKRNNNEISQRREPNSYTNPRKSTQNTATQRTPSNIKRVSKLPRNSRVEKIRGKQFYKHNNSYYRRIQHNNRWVYEYCEPFNPVYQVYYYGSVGNYNHNHNHNVNTNVNTNVNYNHNYNDYYGNPQEVMDYMPRNHRIIRIQGSIFYLYNGVIYKKIREHGDVIYVLVGDIY